MLTVKKVEGSVFQGAGSWNDYAQTLDVSAPITEDKTIRSRFIIKNEDANAFYDNYDKKNKLFYGIVDADLEILQPCPLNCNLPRL